MKIVDKSQDTCYLPTSSHQTAQVAVLSHHFGCGRSGAVTPTTKPCCPCTRLEGHCISAGYSFGELPQERLCLIGVERHTLTTPVGSHERSFCTLPRLPDRHNIYRSRLTRAPGKRQQVAAEPSPGELRDDDTKPTAGCCGAPCAEELKAAT